MNCTPAYYPIGAWPGYQKGRLFKYPLFQREKMSLYQCQILVGRSGTLLNYTNLNFLVSSSSWLVSVVYCTDRIIDL